MKVVIIGSGPAGIVASHLIKKLKPEASVTIITKEECIVVRCSEVYAIAGETEIEKIIKPDKVITSAGVELVRDEVIEVDIKNKKLKTKNGKEFIYEYLVFATGSRPFKPSIPGAELENVFTLRTAEDVRKIKQAIKDINELVIIGGGMIGVELASLLCNKLKVTLIELAPHLLYNAYDDELCEIVENKLREAGVEVLIGKRVEEIRGSEKVESVRVEGKEIKADMVIFATGVRANKELAENAGIQTGKFGIKVNERMETNMENVYAIGDCTESFSAITNKPMPCGLVSTAIAQAKVAGMNICNMEAKFEGVIAPSITKIFDITLGRVGLTERQAKEEGIDVLVGSFEGLNKYDTQKNSKPLILKLVFNKNHELIGGEVLTSGNVVASIIDFLSFAVLKKIKGEELKKLRYCAHPELTPLPFFNAIVNATEEALG